MYEPKQDARIRIIFAAIYFFTAIIILTLFWHQIINKKRFFALSQHNSLRFIPIESPRGNIFDRNGKILVTNRTCFDAAILPFSKDNNEEVFLKLGKILEIPAQDLKKRFDAQGKSSPFMLKIIAQGINKEKALAIEEQSLKMPGVLAQAYPLRQYIYNEVGSHIFGYIGKIAEYEIEGWDIFGYRFYDKVGKDGIERNYDIYLKGVNGTERIIVDNRQRKIKSLSHTAPIAGKDLQLTIDLGLQIFAHNLLAGKKGAIIVMDPNDGKILAMESSPSFDPNLFATSAKRIDSVLKDPAHPLINRAIAGQYPPGSIFKIVIAAGGLEEGLINQNAIFYCPGFYNLPNSRFRCWLETGHGNTDLKTALAASCNVYFYNLGKNLKVEKIAKYAGIFGLGRKTEIDLNNEKIGIIPDAKWKKKAKNEPWYEGETILYSIGQGYLLITPIGALQVISSIANGGYIVKPYLVKSIGGVDVSSKRVENLNIKKSHIAIIKDALKGTVESEIGTGFRAKAADISIAGKTGTAQVSEGSPHAWFIGFAPAEEPKISFVIFLERGMSGGAEPAIFAKQIVEYIRDYTDLMTNDKIQMTK